MNDRYEFAEADTLFELEMVQFETSFQLVNPLGSEVLGRHLTKSSFRDFVGISLGYVFYS